MVIHNLQEFQFDIGIWVNLEVRAFEDTNQYFVCPPKACTNFGIRVDILLEGLNQVLKKNLLEDNW